jgi:protein-L-isoaspartate O-methyltransferase
VIPVGDREQTLLLLEKDESGAVTRSSLFPVRFVPMTGEAMRRER